MKTTKIVLLKGDITERDTDAIINTANNRLILGSGLGGAIKAKGGSTIVAECAKYGTIPIGDAVLTKAGSLSTGSIIHAVLTEFDGEIQEENIARSLLSSLRLAKKRKLKSISIPDFSIGITKFSTELCAHTVFTVLKEFIQKENRYLELIEIVLWDIESLRIYKNLYPGFFERDVI